MTLAAEQTLKQLRATRPHQAVDPDNLPGPHLKTDVINQGIAVGADAGDVLRLKNRRAKITLVRQEGGHRLTAEHLANDPRHIDGADRRFCLKASVAQNRNHVANCHQLFQPMRNINEGNALLRQVADDPEEDLNFGFTQRRGGLVKNQNVCVFRQRFSDLHQLLLTHFEIADPLTGRDRLVKTRHQCGGAPCLLRLIDRRQATLDLPAQKQVLRHGEVFKQIQLLMHHADAVPGGIAGAAQRQRLTIQKQRPGGRLLHARQNLHQRRFARAVFTDNHIHFAAPDPVIDAIQRQRAGKQHGDLFSPQNNVIFHQGVPRFSSIATTSSTLFCPMLTASSACTGWLTQLASSGGNCFTAWRLSARVSWAYCT